MRLRQATTMFHLKFDRHYIINMSLTDYLLGIFQKGRSSRVV